MLAINDLSKTYGDVVALEGCSFTVEPGRMLGFLGPNGAGKTTTMRAIFGLLRPDAGDVPWNGHPIAPEARLRFGYMPEQRGLYPKMKVVEQLVYFGRLHAMSAEARAAAEELLDELGLTNRRDPLDDLSHGNQQRVQLAAALVHSPELLVLDEPFNGLDPIGAETMANVLRSRVAAGAAVVFSSHQLDLVEDLCEDVAIIHRGRLSWAARYADCKIDHRTESSRSRWPNGADVWHIERCRDVVVRRLRHRLVVDADQDVTSLLADARVGRPVPLLILHPDPFRPVQGGSRMTACETLKLVVERELVERGKSKAFLIRHRFTMLLLTASIVVPVVLDHRTQSYDVGLVGDGNQPIVDAALALGNANEDDGGVEITTVDLDSVAALESALDDETVGLVSSTPRT